MIETVQDAPTSRRARGLGAVYLRGTTWWIRYYVNGKRREASSKSAERSVAEALLKRRIGDVARGLDSPNADKTTLGQLLELLRAHTQSKHLGAPKVPRVCEWFDVETARDPDGTMRYKGGWKAKAVTFAVLQKYVGERQAASAADATIHNELAEIRRAFRLGKKAGLVVVVPEIPMPKVMNTRESFFTVAELDRLLTLLPEPLRAPVQFAALTGMRAGNVLALPWTHVDFGRGVVRVPVGMTKTGEPLTVPFGHGSELERLLRAQEQGQHGPWVFHRRGKRIKSYRGAWKKAVEQLGPAAYGEQFDPKTRSTKKVLKRFHDLRHTFAQHMTDAGVSVADLLALGGWKTPAMLDRYRFVNEARKAAAATQRDRHVAAEREKAKAETPVLHFGDKTGTNGAS